MQHESRFRRIRGGRGRVQPAEPHVARSEQALKRWERGCVKDGKLRAEVERLARRREQQRRLRAAQLAPAQPVDNFC